MLMVGVGATNGRVLAPEAVSFLTYVVSTPGLLHHVDRWSGSPPRQERHAPISHTLLIRGANPSSWARAQSLAAALVSTESFTFNGKIAETAYTQFQKDIDGGWIWGSNVLMSDNWKDSLQTAVRSRKSAFAYSMEKSWVIMELWERSAFRWTLTKRLYNPRGGTVLRSSSYVYDYYTGPKPLTARAGGSVEGNH